MSENSQYLDRVDFDAMNQESGEVLYDIVKTHYPQLGQYAPNVAGLPTASFIKKPNLTGSDAF